MKKASKVKRDRSQPDSPNQDKPIRNSNTQIHRPTQWAGLSAVGLLTVLRDSHVWRHSEMVVASLKSLLQRGHVMHAAIVSLFTFTTWFDIVSPFISPRSRTNYSILTIPITDWGESECFSPSFLLLQLLHHRQQQQQPPRRHLERCMSAAPPTPDHITYVHSCPNCLPALKRIPQLKKLHAPHHATPSIHTTNPNNKSNIHASSIHVYICRPRGSWGVNIHTHT